MGRKLIRRMLLFGSGLLLVVTLLVLPSLHFAHIADAQKWVAHTLVVLNASEDLLASTESAETSERGYLLTGGTRYLETFQAALREQVQSRKELRQLTVDNASQQVRISSLDKSLDVRFAELSRIIQLYQTKGPAEAVQAVKDSPGSQAMNKIRAEILDLQQEERRLLKIRNAVVDTEATSLKRTLSFGATLLIVLLSVFAVVSENDIRRHKKSEELAKEREEQFHTLANAMPQLCWMAKPDGSVFWYNNRWFEFTGTNLQAMSGSGWKSLHDPTMLPLVMERWHDSIASAKPFEMIFPLRAADGTFHTFLTRVMPLCDESGKVLRWFGTNTDISAQRATEDSLRAYQERLRLAQEVAQIGTFEWNLLTNEKQRTPELESMFGQPPGSFAKTGKVWVDFVSPEDRENVLRHLELAHGTGTFELEWRVVWPNGEERWHFGRARVVKDQGGNPLRVIGAIVDITGRKRAELELINLNAELEQRVRSRTAELENANKELAAFAYSVSHDLRAPLRGIDGWSMALLEDYAHQLDATAHNYLNRVRSETQRMGNLIDDMWQLSRVTRDEMRFDFVDLTALACGISSQLQFSQPDRSIEFVIAPQLATQGDGRLLAIALTNLLSNAVKFTGKRQLARIEFGSALQQGRRAFYVRDNGAGFDMKYADTLFGAFQRLHKVSEFPGTGIGLAIVQRVIGRHSGNVWAEAQVDSGATFWFTLGVHS